MPMLPVDTVISVDLGPAIDDTDFKALETVAYNAAGLAVDLVKLSANGATKVDITPSNTDDADHNYWTATADGHVRLRITAAQNDTEGTLYVSAIATGVCVFESPVYQIVPTQVYASLVAGSDSLQVHTAEITDGLVKNATFAADVGSTAYATNIIALAVRKVLDEIKLDHLVAVADSDDVVDNSIVAKLAATAGDWSTFAFATDSLQSIRDENAPIMADWTNDGRLDALLDSIIAAAGTAAAYAVVNSGMGFRGNVTSVPGANQFAISTIAGLGAGMFSDAVSPWYALVLRDAGGAGAAPQGEFEKVTAYNTATGAFTTDPFTAAVDTGDNVMIINPRLADLASIRVSTDAIKLKTDNLPGSPAAVGSAMTLAAGAITNATFAADVGTTAYATNHIALAADKAIVERRLDHLIAVADSDDVVNNSIIAKLAATAGDWSTFVDTTDSLQSIRDKLPTNLEDLTVTDTSGLVSVGTIGNDVITAASIANGAIDAATFAAGAITAAVIADAAITNATFAADVGTTAYASNHIALATDKALVEQKLDHLVAVADSDDAVNNSLIAKLAASDGDWSGYSAATDSLEALRDQGDAAWITAEGFAVAGDAMTLAADAIKAISYDESTAFPLKAADTGVTQIARVGADGDTLETLSDQIDTIDADAIADAVWDEDQSEHEDAGSAGYILGWLQDVLEGDMKVEASDPYTLIIYLKDTATALVTKYLYTKAGVAITAATDIVGQQLESEL